MANYGQEKVNKITNMKNDIENLGTPSAETAKPVQIQPLFYDLKQAASALNMSTKTVRRLVWRGRLTTCKAVRKMLIPRKQIEEFSRASCDIPHPAS
jgi:excisionase family DNA binding protein